MVDEKQKPATGTRYAWVRARVLGGKTNLWGRVALRMSDHDFKAAEEILKVAGAEDIRVRRDVLTEGWSIHELGTARMGTDPKSSVTNSFGQTHDVKNLFVVDGSIFVSASCQNPTWTILALCWRAMDYLKDELRRGNLS